MRDIHSSDPATPDPEPLDPEALERDTDAAIGRALGQSVPAVLPTLGGEPEGSPEPPPGDERSSDISQAAEPQATERRASELQGPTVVLERKHPLAIRWMHWINFPVLFTMIWSGLLIYWNDSDNAYLHPHAVYRVGLGSVTLFRFFPPWFYTNRFWDMRYLVTEGLGWHFLFMWIFALNGIFYAAFLLWSKEWKFMVPQRQSLREAVEVTLFDLHLRRQLPPQTKYNGAQRIAYSSTILMGFGALLTGLAIYKPTQAHWLTSLLGGYEMARWLHFWITIGFCAFFLVHVAQVALAGWNNFRSMVSGYELRRRGEPSLEAERRAW